MWQAPSASKMRALYAERDKLRAQLETQAASTRAFIARCKTLEEKLRALGVEP